MYTHFIEFANYRVPLSKFLLGILEYYQINLSQLSVIGAAKVSHFEIICRALGRIPTLELEQPFFLWIDALVFPLSTSWFSSTSVDKDPLSVDEAVDLPCVELGSLDPKEEDHSEFRQRVLPGVPNLKGEHVLKLINKDVKFNKLDDEDAIGNQSENVPVCGLDQQFMEGVSQCMNVDEPYKNFNDVLYNFPINGLDHRPMEGVSQRTILNDEYESVAIDGLISLRSQDVGHISKKFFVRDDPEFKVNENEEASHSESFLSTQQVRELMNDIFSPPSLGPNSVKDDACVSELIDVNNVLDDVHIDSVVKDAEESENPLNIKRVSKRVIKTIFGSDGNENQQLPWKEDLTHSPTAPNAWTFPWVDDGHLVHIDFWEKLVGMSHTKRGWLSSDHLDIWIEYLWQFRDSNANWAIARPYPSDMLSRFEYPFITLMV
ncbi:hypothetical protein Tco_0140147 [Tanacetum coccineum]